jgi:uncharacterized protein (DUF885 family)
MQKKLLTGVVLAALFGVASLSPLNANAANASTATPAAQSHAGDQAVTQLSAQFINELWQADPDAALGAGRFEQAAHLSIPDLGTRTRLSAFHDGWLARFDHIDAQQLSPKAATDLALLKNTLHARSWYLNTFRDFEWDPSNYNISDAMDAILQTEYAPKPERLRALLQRMAQVPAYYAAARSNIKHPTREHTQLAIKQSPGALQVLKQVEEAAQASTLTRAEKRLMAKRCKAARVAVNGYIQWLHAEDRQLAQGGARSFRIGKQLYEAKFALDIQSSFTAEQLYNNALAAKEQLLTKMDGLADQLWAKTMGDSLKPVERSQKIGMVIQTLSQQHVPRAQLFAEVRRQLPVLQDWVVSHDLLGFDASKPLAVRETPVYQRGVSVASIDAPGPYRPQDKTYYNVTPLTDSTPEQAESSLREYNQWILQILNIHEAIPGHYTQLVYANRSPSLVKSLFGNGAMVEGWAVYGERMMLESGYGGNTPEMWLMYSKWNLRTVCNTILDYSTHVLGMTEAQALQLLTRDAFQTEAEARGKWQRVQLTSVQLTSYFSGFSEILALREERKQALGDKFNLKQFHETFLSFGSAPVSVIRQLMSAP